MQPHDLTTSRPHRLISVGILTLLLFFITSPAFCQTTNIPDPKFEQALIDLGIDSDGSINGQVLTSDIETVTTLDLNHLQINDLTGLEDFSALEILDATGNLLTFLDVSQNIELKELYCSSDSAGFNMMISSLDITNNINMEVLYAENLIYLETLNLKNGNNIILSVELSCGYEGEPCQLTELTCVTVDDEVAAASNQTPYSDWYIAADFAYSEDCSLGVFSLENVGFSILQNPVVENLVLMSPTFSGNAKLKIFNTEGRLLITQNLLFDKQSFLDVSNLSSGIYFLSIETENGNVEVKKFIKE